MSNQYPEQPGSSKYPRLPIEWEEIGPLSVLSPVSYEERDSWLENKPIRSLTSKELFRGPFFIQISSRQNIDEDNEFESLEYAIKKLLQLGGGWLSNLNSEQKVLVTSKLVRHLTHDDPTFLTRTETTNRFIKRVAKVVSSFTQKDVHVEYAE